MGCSGSKEVDNNSAMNVKAAKEAALTAVTERKEEQSALQQDSSSSRPLNTGIKAVPAEREVAKQISGKEAGPGGRDRRAGVGNKDINQRIKKQLLAPDGNDIVSDSEDEAEAPQTFPVRTDPSSLDQHLSDEVFEKIMHTLQAEYVFAGVRTALLTQVVKHMRRMQLDAGTNVVQQGAPATPNDALYFIETGEVNVIISGGTTNRKDDQVIQSSGAKTIIVKGSGWLFGMLTLLFNSPRSASVETRSPCVLWALDRDIFMRFVMGHAKGARAVRFLRKLPLLSGITDDKLLETASRLKEEVYERGEYLIQAGDRGDGLYVIRYGTVDVKVGDKVVASLGRGKFVGERTLVTGKLRSASCVAQTRVVAIVMQKREFLEVNNPVLDWMIPYDAARATLEHNSHVKSLNLSTDKFEDLLDRFSTKEEATKGTMLIAAGAPITKVTVFLSGTVELTDEKGQVVDASKLPNDNGFLQENGGFSNYGLCALTERKRSPYNVTVKSDLVTYVSLNRHAVSDILGVLEGGKCKISPQSMEFAKGVLSQSHVMSKLSADKLDELVAEMEEQHCVTGQIIAHMDTPANHIIVLLNGQCIVSKTNVSQSTTVKELQSVGHIFMVRGDCYGELMLLKRLKNPASIVAVRNNTTILVLSGQSMLKVLGAKDKEHGEVLLKELVEQAGASAVNDTALDEKSSRPARTVAFQDLQFHRVVGRGQFGSVRLVTHKSTGESYALKVLYKQPISDGKQVEHIINELSVMQACKHQFCVQLNGAYQDQDCLYMLMEWVPGGELFHYIDIYHSFDEATAKFYAANVVLVMEYLHGKGIIYRDLKPENLVLDAQGYLKLADYGFAKHVGSSKTFTICGTPDYQAPEVIMRRGATKMVDYWAIGVLIFELLVGEPPFVSASNDPWDTFRQAMTGRCHVPSYVSEQATDLIYKLLQVSPEKRLGIDGIEDIKRHPWFAKVDWNLLAQKKLKAPIVPKLKNGADTSNFANYDKEMTPPPKNTRKDHALWQMWEWVDTSKLPIHNI